MQRRLYLIVFLLFFIGFSCFIFLPCYVNASEDGQDFDNKPQNLRTFALGISTIKEHGFGCIMRLRSGHFAIDGSVGFMPLLLILEDPYGDPEFEFGMPLHMDAGVVIFINDELSRFQNGIRGSFIKNQGMGNGIMMGWVGELTWNSFAIAFGAGIQYYPDFEDKIRDYFDIGYNYEVPKEGGIQPYIGANFIWYLH